MRTRDVFSFTPVNRDACAKMASSILSVVFIHTNMVTSDVFVKQLMHVLNEKFARKSNVHGDDSFGGALSAPSDDIRPPCCSRAFLFSILGGGVPM